MEELDLNNYLFKQNLFELFKFQLKKDFESTGLDVDFTELLPNNMKDLQKTIQKEIEGVMKRQSHLFPMLLYRIDISESQIKKYSEKDPDSSYEELLSELIIKRILQKVILKKTFSEKSKPIE